MVDSLQIDAGNIRLSINNDENRIVEFNPNDVLFVEKFYVLLQEYTEKIEGYQKRAKTLEASEGINDLGVPINTPDRIQLLREVCVYTREKIDYVFGEGTSQIAFGEALNIDMFTQFFEGIVPFIEKTRSEKIKKYITAGIKSRSNERTS